MSWFRYRKYVPVATRRSQAASYGRNLAKKRGAPLEPVNIAGRKITSTFWGDAWCANLEQYSDFANRLPRGRTYVRNGSVIDLKIKSGEIHALVSGSDVYTIKIQIGRLPSARWETLCGECAHEVDSLFDLLQGRLSNGVMKRLTAPADGLFPQPKEIKMSCSCPDWAYVCKHVAATMYGVGHRLDQSPELLFLLRGVDHHELVSQATAAGSLRNSLTSGSEHSLDGADLSDLFGIELDSSATSPDAAASEPTRPARQPARRGRGAAKNRTATTSQETPAETGGGSSVERLSSSRLESTSSPSPSDLVSSSRRTAKTKAARTAATKAAPEPHAEAKAARETRRSKKRDATATLMIEIPIPATRAKRRTTVSRRKAPK